MSRRSFPCTRSTRSSRTTRPETATRAARSSAIAGIFSVFPDLSFETRRQYLRDDLVVQRAVEYRGMDVIPIRDGLVARKDVYSDGVTLLRQLGLTAL